MTERISTNRIKALRAEKRLSLADLAEKVGVSRQTVNRYENGIIANIPHENGVRFRRYHRNFRRIQAVF